MTHLPAIIFALSIIIASPSRGVSVIALGVGALTISALHAFKASRRAVCAFNKSSNSMRSYFVSTYLGTLSSSSAFSSSARCWAFSASAVERAYA